MRTSYDENKIFRASQAGVTLIELSIVLLIIGLIAGSIVITRSVIRSSEIQSIASQSQIYAAAITNFTAEFQSLPGDMPDFTQHWSGAFNGDGNGFIDAAITGANQPSEPFQLWRHLELSGKLPIKMTGLNANTFNITAVAGSNVPAGRLSDSGWFVGYDLALLPNMYAVKEGHYFIFGRTQTTGLPVGRLLTPDEAYSLDLKIDNGEPATGNVVAFYFDKTCAEAESGAHIATNFNARYRVEDTTQQCAIAFNMAF